MFSLDVKVSVPSQLLCEVWTRPSSQMWLLELQDGALTWRMGSGPSLGLTLAHVASLRGGGDGPFCSGLISRVDSLSDERPPSSPGLFPCLAPGDRFYWDFFDLL